MIRMLVRKLLDLFSRRSATDTHDVEVITWEKFASAAPTPADTYIIIGREPAPAATKKSKPRKRCRPVKRQSVKAFNKKQGRFGRVYA